MGTIGERIRERRLIKGWSVRFAADRAGISHSSWSRIERGRQGTDNRLTLAAIASALDCPPGDLVEAPGSQKGRPDGDVSELRRALLDEPAAPPVDHPHKRVELLDARRQACDYRAAVRLLPELLRGLRDPRLLCEATFIASSVLRNLGHPADAWLAAERCREAAETTGDPALLAYAAYARANAALVCGAAGRAEQLAASAADQPGTGLELAGSLALICAYASRGDTSRAWAGRAAALAARTGETTTMGLYFGPTNVDIWRIGCETAAGEPERAVEIARRTDPSVIPAGFRQVFYYADTGRALARIRGREKVAVRFLLTAERLAPQHVRVMPGVRETVFDLLSFETAAALRGLGARLGAS